MFVGSSGEEITLSIFIPLHANMLMLPSDFVSIKIKQAAIFISGKSRYIRGESGKEVKEKCLFLGSEHS